MTHKGGPFFGTGTIMSFHLHKKKPTQTSGLFILLDYEFRIVTCKLIDHENYIGGLRSEHMLDCEFLISRFDY